jgi:hypothetical protein
MPGTWGGYRRSNVRAKARPNGRRWPETCPTTTRTTRLTRDQGNLENRNGVPGEAVYVIAGEIVFGVRA